MNPSDRTPDRRTLLKATAGAAAIIALEPRLSAGIARFGAPVRLGLVGTGRQGRAILGELAKFPDVKIVAYCDPNERRLASAGRRVPDARGHASLEAMLGAHPDLDGVVIATPTHLHKTPSLEALSAGKHVYCEAPLAHSIEDARAIAKAARGANKVFVTGMQGRSNPVYDLARSFVRTGTIENVVSMRAQYREKTSWRVPASDAADERQLNWRLDPEVSLGLIGEVGAQQLDVLHWFTGQYPVAVRGKGAVLAHKDGRVVPDTVHFQFDWPSGAILAYEATLGNSYGGQQEVLEGTDGAVKLAWTHGWLFKEADAKTYDWEVYATRERFHQDEAIILIAGATQLAKQGKLKEGIGLEHPPLYYALEAFLKSVATGAPVQCTAEEGLRAVAVAVQADRALREGKEMPITEELFKVG